MSLIYGLEFSVYNLPYVEDFFLHGSNFSYVYNLANPPGSRVEYSTVSVNGQPLDPSATYSVTAPDGVVPFFTQIPGFQVNNLSETGFFVYDVVRDFLIANSPVAYYSEGRVIDLASLEEPLAGVTALSDVVELFGENGSINSQKAAERLRRLLAKVYSHLEGGRDTAACQGLNLFKIRVKFLASRGLISSWSSDRLIYLTNKLTRSFGFPPAKTSALETGGILPQKFQLHQNYPNPFNPETQISYNLSEGTHVKLTVYNVLGQQVKVLVDEFQSAGTNIVIWDSRNENGKRVSSGIYFYKLQAGEVIQTKKMSLAK
jgi:hypothetical protein